MKFIKNYLKVIIAFIVGISLSSGIVYAAISASQVIYKDGKNVEEALNDLYSRINISAQQVETLKTQGASYTFKNNGYITGTVQSSYDIAAAIIYFNEIDNNHVVFIAPSSANFPYTSISIYAPKGTTVYTRESYGTYNLVLYEFK